MSVRVCAHCQLLKPQRRSQQADANLSHRRNRKQSDVEIALHAVCQVCSHIRELKEEEKKST